MQRSAGHFPQEPGRLPELSRYQQEPPQMGSGAPGKDGLLELEFCRKDGRSILNQMKRRVPLLVQKALYFDETMPEMPCVVMVSTSGCVLQGDRLSLSIEVKEGACAHVTTQSATKIHSMDANYAAQWQKIRLQKDSYLELMPDPIIPHRNSRFISDTVIECAAGATLIYSEVLMPGRKYHHEQERFGFELFSSRITAFDEQGNKLFCEKQLFTPHSSPLAVTGVMEDFDVYGNVVVMTDKKYHREILQQTKACYEEAYCYGVSVLPGDCGMIFKVLARDASLVKNIIREFWGRVREVTQGVPLPTPFIWKK